VKFSGRRALVYWLLLFGLYLVLAATVTVEELLVSAAGAGIAVTVMMAVRSTSRYHFQLSAGWLRRFGQVPAEVVIDCAVVYRAILRRPRLRQGSGRFQSRSYEPGNEHPSARLRRALVTTAVSLAPNTLVIGVPETGDELLVHQLVPEPEKPHDVQWPL
jgi:multisubunit Na+/H+ antiporter MnhE subunit